MAFKHSVSTEFLSTFVDSIKVFDCYLPSVGTLYVVKVMHIKMVHSMQNKNMTIDAKTYPINPLLSPIKARL